MKEKIKEFKARFYSLAEKIELKYRVPALLTLAVCALETGWGRSIPSNNCFGIKATEKEKKMVNYSKTFEYENGEKVTRYCRFASYDNVANSFDAFGRLLCASRYLRVLNTASLEDACQALQECGYSTSPTYGDTLFRIIKLLKTC